MDYKNEDHYLYVIKGLETVFNSVVGDATPGLVMIDGGTRVAWYSAATCTPPPDMTVLVAKEFFRPGDWRVKAGGFSKEKQSWVVWGASWEPSHWAFLPCNPDGTSSIPNNWVPQ